MGVLRTLYFDKEEAPFDSCIDSKRLTLIMTVNCEAFIANIGTEELVSLFNWFNHVHLCIIFSAIFG